MWAILVFLFIGVLIAGIIYLRNLVDKKIHLKVVCPVCFGVYNLDEFRWSGIRKEKICVKCKLAEELNKREMI